MAEADKKNQPGLGATLWSLLMIVCLLLVVAHLVSAVLHDTVGEEDLIQKTFTTVRKGSSHQTGDGLPRTFSQLFVAPQG